ncbi:MAG: hypothetical protein QOE45_1535 [Frankiaceae bacterium]|jgi:hypothetical protein|nr:hypothetical protein [Frankiaceae bacterium]
MRLIRRLLLGVAMTGAVFLGPIAAAMHADAAGSVVVGTSAESWYRTAPTCTLPVGCVAGDPGTPSPYAGGTLHVAASLGTEQARTYLTLDLSMLPAGATATGGQLRLPVATGPQDGTLAADTATMRACPAPQPAVPADGTYATPPAPDCAAASVPAVYVPATGSTAAAFTVDLAPLVAAWRTAPSQGSLALLPSEGTAPAGTWHVAFSQRNRSGTGVAQIVAAIAYEERATEVPTPPPPTVAPPVATGFVPGPPLAGNPGTTAPVPTQPAPTAAPVAVAPQGAGAAAAVAVPVGFRYPGVFLLPLVLAGAATWVGRSLTRDLAADPVTPGATPRTA